MGAPAPDLELEIHGHGPAFGIELSCPRLDVESPPPETVVVDGAEIRLPKTIEAFLWSRRASHRTLQIISESTGPAWEQVEIHGADAAPLRLTEAFATTCWLRGAPPPATHFSIDHFAVAVRDGAEAAGLRQDLELIQRPYRRVVDLEATRQNLLDALEVGPFGAWHLAIPTGPEETEGACLHLDRGERLACTELVAEVTFGLDTRPLVFFDPGTANGSSGGRTADHGPWPEAFLTLGAGALVIVERSVSRHSARRFGRRFYRHLFAGVPLGEAVRRARSELKATDDSSPAAVRAFGHPAATCRVGSATVVAP